MGDYSSAVRAARDQLSGCSIYVFDLDGVVRDFGADPVEPDVEVSLGLESGAWGSIAFNPVHLQRVTTGMITFEQWCEAISEDLARGGAAPCAVKDAISRWVAYRGTVVQPTVDWMEQLRGDGRPVFVFTNGTDAIPRELEQIGLPHLIPATINSAVLGVAKPDRDAYAAAHARIESDLQRRVDPSDVGFIDDRISNVDGARQFGWRAALFDSSAAAGSGAHSEP